MIKNQKNWIIEGKIKFKTDSQFLEASSIEYDFISKKGYILNAYGSVNFAELSKINVNKISNKNYLDNVNQQSQIREVQKQNTSNIELSSSYGSEEDGSLSKQTLITNFNQVNKLRFKTNKILIDENVWFSKNLS